MVAGYAITRNASAVAECRPRPFATTSGRSVRGQTVVKIANVDHWLSSELASDQAFHGVAPRGFEPPLPP